MRVVADHSRAAAFLLADGVLPANEGRGYVLRRIMRRAIRHAQRLSPDPGLYAKVCAKVIELMGDAYPELVESRVRIVDTVQHETDLFLRTLDRGNAILAEELRRSKRVSGDLAFKLHDTYGFPLDLTQVIAAESGASVDVDTFEKLMEEQRARGAFAGSGEAAIADVHKSLATEVGESEFLGYQQVAAEATLKAILVSGKRVSKISTGEEGELTFDRTPFYGESGGQVGDTGFVTSSSSRAQILDTQRPVQGLIVHKAKVLEGAFTVGEKVEQVPNLQQAVARIMAQARKGLEIQRYKGLGEMNPGQLWETTMNPATRTLLQVKIDDAVEADMIFSTLMGDEVEPRRKFIEENALNTRNLDI